MTGRIGAQAQAAELVAAIKAEEEQLQLLRAQVHLSGPEPCIAEASCPDSILCVLSIEHITVVYKTSSWDGFNLWKQDDLLGAMNCHSCPRSSTRQRRHRRSAARQSGRGRRAGLGQQ